MKNLKSSKDILKYKKLKVWVMILATFLSLGVTAACVSNDDEDIEGYYRYEKTIYALPLSSYIAQQENVDYVITEDSFTIRNIDGSKEMIATNFEKSEVDIESFTALFKPTINVPEISGFKQRYQFFINERYRMYTMDREVWLALCPEDTIWRIYQLDKVEDESDR